MKFFLKSNSGTSHLVESDRINIVGRVEIFEIKALYDGVEIRTAGDIKVINNCVFSGQS